MKRLMNLIYAIIVLAIVPMTLHARDITINSATANNGIVKFNYSLLTDSSSAISLVQKYLSLDSVTFYPIGSEIVTGSLINKLDSLSWTTPDGGNVWIKITVQDVKDSIISNTSKADYFIPKAPWAEILNITATGTTAFVSGVLITSRQPTELYIIWQTGDTTHFSLQAKTTDTNFDIPVDFRLTNHLYNVKLYLVNATGNFTSTSFPFIITVTGNKEAEKNANIIVNQNSLILNNSDLSGQQFKIINIGGQTMMSGILSGNDEINISSLQKNVYILITADGFIKKFIKK